MTQERLIKEITKKLNRKEYILQMVILFAISFGFGFLWAMIGLSGSLIAVAIGGVLRVLEFWVIQRRMADAGFNTWCILICVIPIPYWVILIELLMIIPKTKKLNIFYRKHY